MVVVHAPTGDWEVLGDEFRMLAERGRLDDPKVSARIGAYCRRARLEAGLTQAEAAALTGIAAPNISRLERARPRPGSSRSNASPTPTDDDRRHARAEE